MSLSHALSRFREERNLSLRELGTLAGIDHAYIHRLETGEKISPSEDVLSALIRALKLSGHRAKLFRSLVGQTYDSALVDVFVEDEQLSLELLAPLAEMSFRGKRPANKEDWKRQAVRLAEFLEDYED